MTLKQSQSPVLLPVSPLFLHSTCAVFIIIIIVAVVVVVVVVAAVVAVVAAVVVVINPFSRNGILKFTVCILN